MHTSLLQMLQPAAQPAAQPTARSSTTSSSPLTSSSSSANPGVDLTSTFLQLLTIQLKNQSPIAPLDPNQFVVQLAQFDSLGELTQIQSLMQTLVNDVGGSSSPPSGASAAANATSTPSPNFISH